MVKKKKAGKRQYSDSDKATALAALDANGGNVRRTARETGIPEKTIADWRDGRGVVPEVAEIREEKKEALGDVFERVSRLYLERALSEDAVSETKGKDAVIAAATAADKMQLLRGRPTAIIAQSAKDALAAVMRDYGLSQEQAAPMVAAEFGISETELLSEAVN
ncbi:MAG TPA: hypothetical protein VEB22_06650 [Phycisphaerales bacterium]|nr:hypothetical protein [Phycisphaerales bacterium]